MADQPAPPLPNPPSSPAQTPVKSPSEKPLIGFNVLFIGSIIFAFFVIIFSLFIMRTNWLRIPIPVPTYINNEPKRITPTPKNSEWIVYTSPEYGYTFEYPNSYRVEQGEKGTQLLEKISVFDSNYQYPLFKVTVWAYPSGVLQRKDIEMWCFRTLLEEARKENLLCAFMSSAAIDEVEIDDTLVYTVSSYSSFGEKVEYYIIPQNGRVIIIQSVTLLNEQRLDNGKSKAKEILQTLTL